MSCYIIVISTYIIIYLLHVKNLASTSINPKMNMLVIDLFTHILGEIPWLRQDLDPEDFDILVLLDADDVSDEFLEDWLREAWPNNWGDGDFNLVKNNVTHRSLYIIYIHTCVCDYCLFMYMYIDTYITHTIHVYIYSYIAQRKVQWIKYPKRWRYWTPSLGGPCLKFHAVHRLQVLYVV